jgi:hypothetical protein
MPADCAVRHRADGLRGTGVGNAYQGACDDEEAQPLLECRGDLSRRLFYLVAAAGRDHGPDQKTDIGGVVTSPNGPEAGVWVIAETHDLPTR